MPMKMGGTNSRRSRPMPGRERAIIANKYQMGKKIGSGSFGDVYLGRLPNTNKKIALKVEHKGNQFLKMEAEAYQALKGGLGIPRAKFIGTRNGVSVMAMELLGLSLADVFTRCNKKFPLQTVLILADQIIAILEYIHGKGYVHRDIKPGNLLLGLGRKAHLVHLIDFGMAKKVNQEDNNDNDETRPRESLVGTAVFASVNAHLGTQASYRDDLESLGYLLISFLKGSLPWFSVQRPTRAEKNSAIYEMKRSIPVDSLCQDLPIEFTTYLKYCRELSFGSRPNYSTLRSLFHDLLVKNGLSSELVFNWNRNVLKRAKSRSMRKSCPY